MPRCMGGSLRTTAALRGSSEHDMQTTNTALIYICRQEETRSKQAHLWRPWRVLAPNPNLYTRAPPKQPHCHLLLNQQRRHGIKMTLPWERRRVRLGASPHKRALVYDGLQIVG